MFPTTILDDEYDIQEDIEMVSESPYKITLKYRKEPWFDLCMAGPDIVLNDVNYLFKHIEKKYKDTQDDLGEAIVDAVCKRFSETAEVYFRFPFLSSVAGPNFAHPNAMAEVITKTPWSTTKRILLDIDMPEEDVKAILTEYFTQGHVGLDEDVYDNLKRKYESFCAEGGSAAVVDTECRKEDENEKTED